MSTTEVAPVELVESRILVIPQQKVLLDSDLADLYQVTTGNLNKAVKRNLERFPEDFMFQLTPEELESSIFQIGISNETRGGRRFGCGQLLATHDELSRRLDQFETIQQLIEAPTTTPLSEPKRIIGFPTSQLVGSGR